MIQSRMEPLSQLMPFNEHRFDAAMAFLAYKNNRILSRYYMMKLHVMIDVIHVLKHGSPMIGGPLSPWDHGPVVKEAYVRLKQWWAHFKRTGEQPAKFELLPTPGKMIYHKPTIRPNENDFSPSEIDAMTLAWREVMPKKWTESKYYFHNAATFMGQAYQKARTEARDIDWNDIIEAYDELNGTDHSYVKSMIRL